jgi:hypothetical protein
MHQKLSFSSCEYGGEIYNSGENIPNYNGKSDCTCNLDGTIKCGEETNDTGYSDFSSSNLKFTYSYLNLLSKDSVVKEDVNATSASYVAGTLSVNLERNVLCSASNEAPVQTGFYKLSSSELRLIVMTSTDSSKYTTPCKIENSFVISNLDISLDSNFQIYYQSADESVTNLGACVYNGTLYGSQEAFKSQDSKSICLCDIGKITCNDLQ